MIRIGLDLDNCIFDSEPLYKKAFEGTGYKYFLPYRYLVSTVYPKEVANKLISLFKEDIVYTTKPYDITLAPYINNLIKTNQCEFHVITARSTKSNPLTNTYHQLRETEFKIPISNIHITSFNKTDAINKYNLDYMIDDNPHVIEDCKNTKTTPILISNEKTPYNQYIRRKVEWHPDVKTALILLTRSH